MSNSIESERDQLVVKDNELVRKARYNLTVNQQKIIAYIVSKIKPTDSEFTKYEISVQDFCAVCGIDKEHFYTEIKEIIDNLDNKAFWVETNEKIFKFRWFSEVEIIKGSGKIKLLLNSNIKSYLLQLQKSFTQYELYNILALKGKYSIRLYEWFKSYSFMKEKKIELSKLKYILEAENYTEYRAFRRRVIEPAISEINEFTDLEVRYEKVVNGRSVTDLIFYIRFKEALERYGSYRHTIDVLNKKAGLAEGQISLFDKQEEDFK